MYEVGQWFVWIIDAAVIAVVGMFAMVFILYKRGVYQKKAVTCILAEILLPSGWPQYHIVPCAIDSRSISIDQGVDKDGKPLGDFVYMLNPKRRRYTLYPQNPIMGLKWLQVPIRTETWFQDNPEPIQEDYSNKIATAAEIKAVTREIQATAVAMEVQEMEARQKELIKAISNQPAKMIVYIGLGCAALFSLVSLIIVAQMAGISMGG